MADYPEHLAHHQDVMNMQPGEGMPKEKEQFGTHWYNPIGWDRFDPKPHPGSRAIAPGARVQSHGRIRGVPNAGKLTFHHVEDEHGNQMSVARGSLSKSRPDVEEGMEAHFPGLYNDRRHEGRRDSPS
jgi:hypothetical protein